jgi:hypothetical protein
MRSPVPLRIDVEFQEERRQNGLRKCLSRISSTGKDRK